MLDGYVDPKRRSRWDAANVYTWTIFKYDVAKDKLRVQALDAHACARAVDQGKIKGTVSRSGDYTFVRFTDSRENALHFLTTGGDKIWGEGIEYTRMK